VPPGGHAGEVPGDGVRAPGSVGVGVLPPGVRPGGVRPPGVRPPGVPPPGDGVPPPGEGVPPPGEGVPPPGEGVPPPGGGVPPPGEGVPPPGVGVPPGNGASPEPGIRPGGKMVKLGSSGFRGRRRTGGMPIPGASVVPGSMRGIVRPPEPGGLAPPGVNPTRPEPSKMPGARRLPPVTDGPGDRRGVPIPEIEPVITSGGVVRIIEPGGSARAVEELMTPPVTKQAAETLR